MGEKGAKKSQVAADSTSWLVDQLSMPEVTSKAMFGGYGIFYDGNMFGIVDPQGTIFFKTNEKLNGQYDELKADKHGRMPYRAVPLVILDNNESLQSWAQQSIDI